MTTSPGNGHAVLAQLSTGEAQDWLAANIVPLALLVLGLIAIGAAVKSDISKILTMIACAMFGLAIIGLALIPDAPANTARFLTGLFTGG